MTKSTQRIRKNPVLVTLASVVVPISGTIALIQHRYYSQTSDVLRQQYTLKAEKIESELASVRRGLGGNNLLDIRRFIHRRSEKNGLQPPEHSSYYPEGDFYALGHSEYWQYEKTTESQLLRTLSEGDVPRQVLNTINKLAWPIHIWWGKQRPKHGPGEEEELPTFVTVEKVALNELLEVATSRMREEPQESESKAGAAETTAILRDYERLYRADAVGSLFRSILQLRHLAGMNMPDTTYELAEIQKVGNVVYFRINSTLEHNVGQREGRTIYATEESIIISDQKFPYLVHTFVPSAEPLLRADVDRQLITWFANFVVFVE